MITVIFLIQGWWRLLLCFVLTIHTSSIFAVIITQTGVGIVRIGGLGAKREVDPQVGWTNNGFNGPMDGLKMIHTCILNER